MNPGSKYYQLIPEKVLNNLPTLTVILSPGIPHFCPDYLKQVISIVAYHIRKNEDPPLRMIYLRRLVPYAERYLNALVENGVIKRSPHYVPGEVSYRYSFMPEYQSKYICLALNNPKLILRIHKAYAETRREAIRKIHGCASQVKFLRKLTLADGWRDLTETYKDNLDQYNAMMASAIRIVNGDIFYSRDATERRFHSNVTNMKKELRQYLRINGKPLTNIDIKNSQPYLSTIILTYPAKVAGLAKNIALSMLLQTLKVSQNEDVKKYIKLVADGLFYEYLVQEFNREGLLMDRK